MAKYYAQRASSGGLIITESSAVNPEARCFPRQVLHGHVGVKAWIGMRIQQLDHHHGPRSCCESHLTFIPSPV